MENKGWKTRDTSCPFSFLFQGSPSRVFCLRTFYLFLRIRDTTLKRTREGGSLCFLCPVRSFPHGSLKRTLKRKGKHTKTNSFPFPREGSSPFSFKGLLGLFFSPSFKGYNKQEIKAYSLLNISYRFVLSLNLFKI